MGAAARAAVGRMKVHAGRVVNVAILGKLPVFRCQPLPFRRIHRRNLGDPDRRPIDPEPE